MRTRSVMTHSAQPKQNVTCILPTRGRPDFLRRAVLLLELTNPDVKLIVADSSYDAEFGENLKILRSSHLKELIVRRYSYETGFYQKLSDAIAMVETDYFYFMADDDLILKDGVEACCDELEKDTDIICSAGEIFVHNYDRPHSCSTYLNYSLSKYPSQSDVGEDAGLRVSHHMSTYKATFYSVYRAKDCLEPFQTIARIGGDIRLAEIFSSCLVIASGKRCVTQVPFGIRTTHEAANHQTAMHLSKKLRDPVLCMELKRLFDATCNLSMKYSRQNVKPYLAKAVSIYLQRIGVGVEDTVVLQKILLASDSRFKDLPMSVPNFDFLDEIIIKPSGAAEMKLSRSFSNFHELLAICEVSILGIEKGYLQQTLDKADKILSRSLVNGVMVSHLRNVV